MRMQEASFDVEGPVATISEALQRITDCELDVAILDAGLKGESRGPGRLVAARERCRRSSSSQAMMPKCWRRGSATPHSSASLIDNPV